MVQDAPFLSGRFDAMGCPCEILLDTTDPDLHAEALGLAYAEAERIESKYSRFRTGTVVDKINRASGRSVEVDSETAGLLNYASECFSLSDGLFDITAVGGQSKRGWAKVSWVNPFIALPLDVQIDLGGICKEYAADRILALLVNRFGLSTLVNLGGDIAASGSRLWSVGIENVITPGAIARTVHVRQGGVATSGTTKRPGHILHPQTGKPIRRAPESVTVAARTCTEAGFWSTLAILQGAKAESFLQAQSLEFWCYRV